MSFLPIFLISLPIFLIIFFGWLSRKVKISGDDWTSVLNNFAYYVSLPALIITSFWNFDFLKIESLWLIFASLLTICLFSFVVFFFLHFLSITRKEKAAIFLAATTGNTVYMAFPLIELGFGRNYLPAGALIASIYLIIPILFAIFIINYWDDQERKILPHLYNFLKNPLIVSVFAGVILSFVKIEFSLIESMRKTLIMLGATASPVALFALGGFLYGRFLKKGIAEAFLISFLKIIVAPLVIFFGLVYFYPTSNLGIFTLLASMPTAVTTFVIAEKFNLDKDLVGNSILISTILSFLVIPVVFFLTG